LLPSRITTRFLSILLLSLGLLSLSRGQTIIYTADFETAESYAAGTLHGQNGWQVTQGSAAVISTAAFSGTQSVILSPNSLPTVITQSFSQFANQNVLFVDFYSKPTANTDVTLGTIVDADSARTGFVRVGANGQVYAFDGNGSNGGTWTTTVTSLPLDQSDQAQAWVRFTFRQDYSAKKWDLYVNGTMVGHGLGFRDNTKTAFSLFTLQSASGGTTAFDYFYVATENPLFADADKDGLDDAWELKNFGTLVYGPNDDPGSVGHTLAQNFQDGASPWPVPAIASGLRAWYRADLGVVKDGSDKVTQWTDMSGNGSHVIQTAVPAQQPSWVPGALNGKPVIQFAGSTNLVTSASVDIHAASSDQTVIAVIAPGATQTNWSTILDLSSRPSQGFTLQQNGGQTNQYRMWWTGNPAAGWKSSAGATAASGAGVQILSIVKNGTTASDYLNGAVQGTASVPANIQTPIALFEMGNAVGGSYGYSGQIAEVLIYNRALSNSERQQIETALLTRYVNPDSDGDGLPDAWELKYLGTISYVAADDPGGVGRTLLQSYQQSASPWPSATIGGGLRAWYRADLGVIKDSSNRVSQWTDLSGTGAHVTQTVTASQQPVWIASALNGQPALQFSGATSLATTGPVDIHAGNTDQTVIAVLAPSATQSNWSTILDLSSGPSQGFAWQQNGAQINQFKMWWMGNPPAGWQGSPGATAVAGVGVQVLSSVKSGSSAADFLNGVAQGTSVVPANSLIPSAALAVGNAIGGGYAYNGQMAELLVYNRALSDSERQQVEAALLSRYVNPDSDGDGLPDAWELKFFGTLSHVASDDPGGVGRTLLQSYQQTLSPWPAATVTSGLRVWYRADLGVVKDGSNKVSQWTDLSGTGAHVTQTVTQSQQPSWTATAFNGKPAIQFAGATSLATTSPANVNGGSDDETVIAVIAPASNQTNWSTLMDLSSGLSQGFTVQQNAAFSNQYRLWLMGNPPAGWTSGPGATAAAGTGVRIVSFVKNGATALDYLDGVAQGTSTMPATIQKPIAAFAVGNAIGGGSGYNGQIAEILVYNRALTTTERQNIEAALTTGYVNPDSDGDGLPDAWELKNLGTLTYGATDDPGAVGRTLLQSYQQTLSPWPAPTVSSGLHLWYRAELGVTKDASNNVSQWADLSGNGAHVMQPTGSSQPTWTASAFNGKPALQFSGTSNLMTSAPTDIHAGSGDQTVVAVILPSATQTNWSTIMDLSSGPSQGFAWQQDGAQTNRFRMWWTGNPASGWQPSFGATVPSGSAAQIVSVVKTGASAADYLGGVAQGSTTVPTNIQMPATTFEIGNAVGGGYPYSGQIAELLVYNRALSTTERQSIEAALNARYVYTNPDGDGNGLPDAWELSNFGHLGVDPQADPDGDGLTNLQESQRGTNPNAADSDGDGVPDGTEVGLGMNPLLADANTLPTKLAGLRLLLQADVGVTSDANGKVSSWQDQSGRANHAVQSTTGSQPTLVTNVVNGRPTVRFNGGNFFPLPDFMNAASAGEVFVVTSASYAVSAQWRGLWRMGQNPYPHFPITNNAINVEDDWGSATMHSLGTPGQPLNQFNFIDVSSASNGWIYRLDAAVLFQTPSNSVYFRSDPLLGKNSNDFYLGDISELIAYDHVLSTSEREIIGTYLTQKYAFPAIPAPAAPSGLAAAAISPTQVSLTWSGASGTNGTVYTIERQTTGGFTVLAEVTDTQSYFDTGLAAAGTYGYRVKARTLAGSSTYTNVATVTTPTVGGDMPLAAMREWLRADAGITVAAANAVSGWNDQSGHGNHATQSNGTNQPTYVANVANGRPVLRFNGNNFFPLPDFMNGATAGEVFVVVSASYAVSAQWRGLWRMGQNPYPHFPIANNAINIEEDWGSTTIRTVGNPAQALNQFNIYNVSSAASLWSARLNGTVLTQSPTNTVYFRSDPLLGKNTNDYFLGDIAEFISFDRVLSAAERETVGEYLAQKYALASIPVPSAPSNVTAVPLSATQVGLNWTAASAGATFTIERQMGSGPFAFVTDVTGAAFFIDSGLTAGTTYGYRIRAKNYAGASGYSNSATASTASDGADFPLTGIRLWLQADAGVTSGANGISAWQDLGLLGNSATQTDSSRRPTLAANAINGHAAVHFETNTDFLQLPNVMNGATEGEIFTVVKLSSPATGGSTRTMWSIGAGSNLYTQGSGVITEYFGSASGQTGALPVAALGLPHLYNVSAKTGFWQNSINGLPYVTSYTNTVNFSNASPTLGWSGNPIYNLSLWGDIAEILVYDHALSKAERESVGAYLNQKYGFQPAVPDAPSNLTASAITTTQASLTWQGSLLAAGTVYEIERQTGAGAFAPLAEVNNALSYIDGTVAAGRQYSYRVRARNLVGRSAYSNTATATTAYFGMPAMPLSGMKLWLKADAVFTNDRIAVWPDQSPSHNDAIQNDATRTPHVIPSAMNGHSVVRFDSDTAFLQLPNVMNGATQGEIFAVLKITNPAGGTGRTLWSMGSGANSYTDGGGRITEYFGSAGGQPGPIATPILAQPHLYNVSARNGLWQSMLNGASYVVAGSNTVSFSNASPTLGWNGNVVYNRSLSGDVAEIIVYDHALSDVERETVSAYLNSKYAVTAPANLDNFRDLNQDGLADDIGRIFGIDASNDDVDGDGVPNWSEVLNGTDPFDPDSDGDSVPDGSDAFPLNPARSQPLPGDPAHPAPPVITLTKPSDAIPAP
jgi:hypothetical protein